MMNRIKKKIVSIFVQVLGFSVFLLKLAGFKWIIGLASILIFFVYVGWEIRKELAAFIKSRVVAYKEISDTINEKE